MKALTEYADCAGCASKLDAGELAAIMDGLPLAPDFGGDARVLVDFRTSDDAGVYLWPGGPALVQTVDFFTPIVDDPYLFGRIAAANALSDVYAMGGMPRTALAIAALPKDGPTADVVRMIFKGGAEMLAEAGVALLGGHTVTDPEIKFGYSVTGSVDPDRVLTNAGAKPGDVLVLTKPLGTGIIVRARKFGRATDEQLAGAVAVMSTLNREPIVQANALSKGVISACTDVTGFGLAGHASEVAAASGVTIILISGDLPQLPGAAELAAKNLPCGGRANQRHFDSIEVAPGIAHESFLLCVDPQTSGGLLMAVTPDAAPTFVASLRAAGCAAQAVGRVDPRHASGTLVRIE